MSRARYRIKLIDRTNGATYTLRLYLADASLAFDRACARVSRAHGAAAAARLRLLACEVN